MTLPPPNPGVTWKDYEIDTPTFRLTPIEKPDMSPFLVHMTGENEILSILKGKNALTDIKKGHGYLQANVPETNGGVFNAKVVCFTESPTFALDFFRYRSFRRWQADQRFGIGFDKHTLVTKGARPVIYADDELVRIINAAYHRATEEKKKLSIDNYLNVHLVKMVEKMYPLLFPLLENWQEQGFMWEREWRYPDPNGFVFSHQDIRVICCPQDEEPKIRRVLGETANRVDFVRTWQEYDDVTDYLTRQQSKWRARADRLETPKTSAEAIGQLEDHIQQYRIALNSLESYQRFAARFSREASRVSQERKKLAKDVSALEAELAQLKAKQKTPTAKK